jgi:hypothetical protein
MSRAALTIWAFRSAAGILRRAEVRPVSLTIHAL